MRASVDMIRPDGRGGFDVHLDNGATVAMTLAEMFAPRARWQGTVLARSGVWVPVPESARVFEQDRAEWMRRGVDRASTTSNPEGSN